MCVVTVVFDQTKATCKNERQSEEEEGEEEEEDDALCCQQKSGFCLFSKKNDDIMDVDMEDEKDQQNGLIHEYKL